MSNPNPGFPLESWCLYGFGAATIVLRFVSRIRRTGISGVQLDDCLILVGLISYTLLCVSLNQLLQGAGSNLMTADEVTQLTPETTAERVRGSKWVFVSEHAMLLTIWSMKAAMLVLYARITEGIMQKRILNCVIVWVSVSFVGDQLALWTICLPVTQYWAVPVSNPQCASYQYYQIVNAVFNITTDILLLIIGLPPVLKARLSVQQKVILSIVFGMGSFVVVAALLRAIYCTVPALVSYVYMNWYFREASVAIYVTNAPSIWALMRDIFPSLHRLGRSSKKTSQNKHYGNPHSHGMVYVSTGNKTDQGSKSPWKDHFDKDMDMDTLPINELSKTQIVHETHREIHRTGSRDTSMHDTSSISSQETPMEIRRDVTFSVEHVHGRNNV